MKKLRVTLIQTTLLWEDSKGNRMLMDELLKDIKKGSTDLVVLPEVFASGFSMNASKVAEPMHGESVQWMLEAAKRKNVAVCGSLVIRVGKKYFNRFIWVEPSGKTFHYDKRHLFRMAGEDRVFTAGRKRVVIEYKGWRICPQICYDLRFPVWSRNKNNYDVLLFVANWPERRRQAWKSLLVARAIENQCYVVAVNRVGTDGKNLVYAGDSIVHDMWGETMTNIKPYKGSVVTVSLDHDKLIKARNDFPVLLDVDRFSLAR
jgi:predicted amidohydrolase